MNKKMKRNLMILTVVLFVSAAAYLNWNYSQSAANVGKILGESALVSGIIPGGRRFRRGSGSLWGKKELF